MGRQRYWLDLGPHPDERELENLASSVGRRFAVRYSEDRLGNGRLDLVSIPWARMPSRRVRARLVELLDEALPDWAQRYTLQPLVDSVADEWVQSIAAAVFENQVALEEGLGESVAIHAARNVVAKAYAEAAARGLAAAVKRQVSYKQDGRAWQIRKALETTPETS
jgi:hypothetical protein